MPDFAGYAILDSLYKTYEIGYERENINPKLKSLEFKKTSLRWQEDGTNSIRRLFMYRNIFEFSQRELSQDAFLCWLFQFSDISVCEEYSNKNVLKKEMANVIKSISDDVLRLFTGDFSIKPISVSIYKQWESIDIWVVVNDEYSLIIEDKVGSSEHNDQLSRYESIAKKWCDENNQKLYCCYYKSETYSITEKELVMEKGYRAVDRKDVLKVFEKYLDKISDNDVLYDYYMYLKRKNDEEMKYLSLPIIDWQWSQRIGFFKYVDDNIHNKGNNWGYVPNPNGGFCGFWWHIVADNEGYTNYLQFEDNKLCIKLGEVYENQSDVRNKKVLKLCEIAKNHNIRIEKPSRYGYGTYTTLGIININYWFIEQEKGIISIDETLKRLANLQEIVDELAA